MNQGANVSAENQCAMWTDLSGAIQVRATITRDAYARMSKRQLHDFERATGSGSV